MAVGRAAGRPAAADDPAAATQGTADVPKKYQRAVDLALKDMTGRRWEYYVDPFPSFARHAIERCLCDPRDWPMVVLVTNICCTTVAAAMFQFTLQPGTPFAHGFGLAYLVLTTALFDARFILCLHYSAHLKLFSPDRLGAAASGLLNEVLPSLLAPLFGIPSGLYFVHHVAMHHVEDNIFPWDLSSTMPYQRDSFLDFLKYWATYVTATAVYLPCYALMKGRPRLALYAATLMCLWAVALRFAWAFHPTATLWTLCIPVVKSSFTLMFGNFSQHIFVDPARPTDDFVSTYNCLAVLDNRFTFNDGYHIVHHLNARKHWAEMPQAFVDALPKYEARGALLFENLFFFDVGIMVMLGRWRALARRVVQITDQPLSEEEVIAELKRRVQKIPFDATEGLKRD